MALPPHVRAEVQRIADRAARRQLEEHLREGGYGDLLTGRPEALQTQNPTDPPTEDDPTEEKG